MHLTFLGTGAAFTRDPHNFHSNMFVERSLTVSTEERRGLLIDAGSDVRRSMAAQGLDYGNIDTVYISHLHNDHVGGLEWLGFKTYFDPDCAKPKMIIVDEIVDRLWNDCLRGGMEGLDFGTAKLDDFFDVTTVREGEAFVWGDATFEPLRLTHFITGGVASPSFGLMIRCNERTTFLTTDARFERENLQPHYDAADLILHDCETQAFPSDVHAHFDQLIGLPSSVREKMWLYHFNDGELPEAEAAGFLGFATPGQVIGLR